MRKSEKIIQFFFVGVILLVIAVFCVLNIRQFCETFAEHLSGKSQEAETEYKEVFASIETDFQEKIYGKRQMVNMYGLYQKSIDHTVVNNFQYVADDYGILHMINDKENKTVDDFVVEMEKLQQFAQEREIPLLYVQAPNREIVNQGTVIPEFNNDNNVEEQIVTKLNEKEIPVLDLRAELDDGKGINFDLKDLFLHTDLHMQTDAEIWMADKVAGYLEDNYSVKISNKEYLSDMSFYDKKTYPMLGNYGREVGEYFVGLDEFDIYHPKFDTDFELQIIGEGAAERKGTFEEAVLNGYEQSKHDEYTYWVTNFGAFPRPYYKYINNNQPETKILVIADCIPYRALSYLALTVHETDILDPRYFDGTDYWSLAAQEDYDAIVVWQECYLLGYDIIP